MSYHFSRLLFVLAVAFLTGNPRHVLYAQKWADDMFKVKDHNFGDVSRNAKAEYEFEVYNPYVEDIHIRSVTASCSCTTVSVDMATIKTYQTGKVKAHFNTDRFVGARSATLSVVIDKPYYATVQLQVKGNIRTDIIFQPGEVHFGSVSSGKEVEKQIEITYLGRTNWQVTDIKSTNRDISAELTEISRNYGQVKYRLKVKLASDATTGYIDDRIILVSNEGGNREIPIMVQGVVKQGITINPSKLFLGNLEPGQEVSKKIVLRADYPFVIKNVTCPNNHYSFDFQRIINPAQSQNLQIVTVSYKAPQGVIGQQFTDTIRIITDVQLSPLELQTYVKVLTGDDESQDTQTDIAVSDELAQNSLREDDNKLSRFAP